MASVTLTDTQWKALKNCTPRGVPAGGSVTVDVTTGVLTVTWFPLPNASGSSQCVTKHGSGGQQQ